MINILWNKYGLPALALLTGSFFLVLAAMAFVAGISEQAFAQEKVLNLYSARHYQTDEGRSMSTSPNDRNQGQSPRTSKSII